MGQYRIKGLEDFDESPGAAGGRAEVVQPVREPLPNANTVEGMIEGVGIVAHGAKRSPRGKPVIWLVLIAFVGPSLIVAAVILAALLTL